MRKGCYVGELNILREKIILSHCRCSHMQANLIAFQATLILAMIKFFKIILRLVYIA